MIAILDYGAGNLRSVQLAFARLNADAVVTKDADVAMAADGLVLPGVGAFADAMQALENSGLIPVLERAKEVGQPLLGICLGMQALFDGSEEGEGVKGLGFVPGFVRRLPDNKGLKIPHMGWNDIRAEKDSPLLCDLPAEPYVYFVHSYACFCDNADDVLTTTEYGVRFCSSVQRGHIFGTQFHPEKSGRVGEQMLKNFLAFVENKEGR
ncbi:MAG: imidazole glycerol phosphate synthase subunit HisH [Clostridia bacterium]|nr:imidazole glycerol phosphate synthase subunit HisH [Clostridia bacterium]